MSITRFHNSAKAIIIVENRLLAVRIRDDEAGEFCVLPGGRQEPGETLTDALKRECLEELGAPVTVHELCFVRDYIGRTHDFAKKDHNLHLIELIFRCEVNDMTLIGRGTVPDAGQVGVEWLDLDKLAEHRFYPEALRPLLQGDLAQSPLRYLGDTA